MRIGVTELLLIFGVVLLLFGPKKLPELAKSMGQAMKEFKKGQEDLENTFTGNTTTTTEPKPNNNVNVNSTTTEAHIDPVDEKKEV